MVDRELQRKEVYSGICNICKGKVCGEPRGCLAPFIPVSRISIGTKGAGHSMASERRLPGSGRVTGDPDVTLD